MTQETNPRLVPIMATVVIANVLSAGAAFAVRLDNGENCYVPTNVSTVNKAVIGSEFSAQLVPNRYADKVDRTPWLVVFMSKPAAPVAAPRPVQYAIPFSQLEPAPAPVPAAPNTYDRVLATMMEGGVWTTASMFEQLFPNKTRTAGVQDYSSVSAALRSIYHKGECSKFTLWRTSDQTKPSREWFTCHPDRADVDEWAD